MRFGIGYDIHRLSSGRRLVLGGVDIPHGKGLVGHSDADALAHAIIDAILGATASGDIGQLFPNTDPKYRNVSSLKLMTVIAELLRKDGFEVSNVDSIIVAQSPVMAPYIHQMRENIASALSVDIDCVSVKAKTNEGLDAVGSGEAIAAWAIAVIDTKS